MGTPRIWHWLIVLLIVMLVFGTKKLRNIGEDLGGAVKGFKQGVREEDDEDKPADPASSQSPQQGKSAQVIEGEVTEKTKS